MLLVNLVVVVLHMSVGTGVELHEQRSLLVRKTTFRKQILPSELSAEHHAWLIELAKMEKAIANSHGILSASPQGQASIADDCLTPFLKTRQKVSSMVDELLMLSSTVRHHEVALETATQNLATMYEAIAAVQSKLAESKADCNRSNSSQTIELYITAKGQSEADSCLTAAWAKHGARMGQLSASRDKAVGSIAGASKDLLGLDPDLVKMTSRITFIQTELAFDSKSSPEVQPCRNNSSLMTAASDVKRLLQKMQQLLVLIDGCPGRKEFQLESVLEKAMPTEPADPIYKKVVEVSNAMSMLQQQDAVLSPEQQKEDEATLAKFRGDADDKRLEEALKMQEDEAMELNEEPLTFQEPSPLLQAGLGGGGNGPTNGVLVNVGFYGNDDDDDDDSGEDEVMLLDNNAVN